MKEIGTKPWYRHPGRLAGGLIILYFALKMLALIHLAVIGNVVPGITGRLQDRRPEPGEPVVYFYQVGENNYHGWRRGIQYGGYELSVVHSPFVKSYHITTPDPGLPSPFSLWVSVDFWLRMLLAALGMGIGAFVYIVWTRQQQGRLSWHFLHGLHRHHHHGIL